MAIDHIRYDLLTQQALRSVVRTVLADTAKNGLPGEHHFYIEFDTQAPGVRMSAQLREQYPQKMTIILQHQFWDLTVSNDGFEVGLSFGGIPERLGVPFEAITGFFDPSVQFGMQFEVDAESSAASSTAGAEAADAASGKVPESAELPATVSPAAETGDAESSEPGLQNQPASAEVVRLDRFRKK